ncbi:MAG: RNA methyltransferase [Bacteroidetes bacterium]|nr:RNA methyltransferase [Bacteroidota bacterium]
MSEQLPDFDTKRKLRDYLAGFITERRFSLFNKVISNRTRYVSLILEDIYQSHNASAVLRSCDCFGVQDVHIIENKNLYEVNPDVALGSSQWLTLQKYNGLENNTTDCIQRMKGQGYRIIATTPREDAPLLDDFDVKAGKFALMFGTEQEGLTDNAFQLADEFVRIPMFGFTESFNISVSAALCLFHFTSAIRKQKVDWELTETEKLDVQLDWLRATIKESEMIEKMFYKKNN